MNTENTYTPGTTSWLASELGRKNRGIKKVISTEESERRRERIAYARQVKAQKQQTKTT